MHHRDRCFHKIGMLVTNLVLVCFFCGHSHSQGYSNTHYDEKDGLPSSIIYGVTQDRDGFMWFATENGLARFDGTRFRTYTTSNGLPDNAILKVHAGKSGKIYFSPFTHKPYYIQNDSVHELKITPGEEANIAIIGTFINNGENVLLCVEAKHMYAILSNDSVVLLRKLYPGLPPGGAVFSATDSAFIFRSLDSVYLVNNYSKEISKHINPRYGLYRDTVFYELKGYETKDIAFNGRLRNDLFYICGKGFVKIVGGRPLKALHTIHLNKVSAVFTDNESSTWMTTTGNGVYRFPSFNFRYIKNPPPSNEVFSIVKHKGQLLTGSDFSLVRHWIRSDTLQQAGTTDYTQHISKAINTISTALKTNRITRFFPRGDTLYVITDAFLLRIDPGNKILFSPVFPGKDIDIDGGRILYCMGTSVAVLDAKTLTVQDTILRQRSTAGVIFDGNYYIGTIGGLVKINAVDKQITRLSNIHPSLKNRIVCIRKGWDNDLWIATSGAGLVHLKQDKVVDVLDEQSRLTSDICTSLHIDSNAIWVGTNKGLNRISFNGTSPEVMQFSTAYGLTNNFVNCIYTDESFVYVGDQGGIAYFDKRITGNESICALHITGVSQGNHALHIDSFYTFPYNTLNIKIDFTAISFKSAGNNTYYYKLEGLDSGWNTTTNTFVNFPTLPAGEYTLLIRAVNRFGVESTTKSIQIVITPPWWQTWWFISLAGIAFATVVFFIYRRNINAIKRREMIKRNNEARLAALEQQALQAQMNPHFIFNCLNSIQAFILDFDAEGANQYLTAFASMIRQTLDISSHPLISVADEVRYLDTYLQLEKLRFREKFNYRIHVAEEIDTFDTWIPGMLLQPFIENALRHGIQHRTDNEGMITMDILQSDGDNIICEIRDNGVGRKRAEEIKSGQHIEYQSRGTFISQKRVNAINSQFNTTIRIISDDIVDENGNVGGTIVKIIIPEFRKN